jgi:hypothetical protein
MGATEDAARWRFAAAALSPTASAQLPNVQARENLGSPI